MQLSSLIPFVLVALSAHALPTPYRQRGILDSVNILDDVLVFDAAAFPDPANPGNTLVSLQSFVSLRQIDLGPLTSSISAGLEALGLDIGDKISTVEERIRLFGAIGLSGKTVDANIGGCSTPVTLNETSGLPDLGMVLQTASLGKCGGGKELVAQVKSSGFDSRTFNATVFNAPDSGFGVISGTSPLLAFSSYALTWLIKILMIL